MTMISLSAPVCARAQLSASRSISLRLKVGMMTLTKPWTDGNDVGGLFMVGDLIGNPVALPERLSEFDFFAGHDGVGFGEHARAPNSTRGARMLPRNPSTVVGRRADSGRFWSSRPSRNKPH